MTNLGHFCDPEKNHYEAKSWPRHESCSGKAIINFALEDEQIVDCECQCHVVYAIKVNVVSAWTKKSKEGRGDE
jgi:hypothetical protein